jgi:hypothetical protein
MKTIPTTFVQSLAMITRIGHEHEVEVVWQQIREPNTFPTLHVTGRLQGMIPIIIAAYPGNPNAWWEPSEARIKSAASSEDALRTISWNT